MKKKQKNKRKWSKRFNNVKFAFWNPWSYSNERHEYFKSLDNVRARRLQWLGHILRLDEDRLLFTAVQHMFAHRSEGDLLMDDPKTVT